MPAGRPRKPDEIRAAEGRRARKTDPRGGVAPDPTRLVDLDVPAWLAEAAPEAVPHWRRLAPQLARYGLLTELDVDALATLCVSLSTYWRAVREVESNDAWLVETKNGGAAMSPWLMIQAMTRKSVVAGLVDFGMTPAARTRVVTHPQGELFPAADASGRDPLAASRYVQ